MTERHYYFRWRVITYVMAALVLTVFIVSGSQSTAQEGDDSGDAGDNPPGEVATELEFQDGRSVDSIEEVTASFVTYSSRATFNNDWPGLPIEDFEDGKIAAGSATSCNPPLSISPPDTGCFDPGAIQPGIQISNNPGPSGGGLALFGAGWSGNANTKFLVHNYGGQSMDIIFNPGEVYAVGLDVNTLFSNDLVTVSIYGPSNALITSLTASGTIAGSFWGIASQDYITRINLIAQTAGIFAGADNIAFGGAFALDSYSGRLAFENDYPGLHTEDFEEGNVVDGGIVGCDAPLNMGTNDFCYSPGDILGGVTIQDNPGPDSFALALVGKANPNNGGANPSKYIINNYSNETMDILFTGFDVMAVGMDLSVFFGGATASTVIKVYGAGDTLLGTQIRDSTYTGNFWGVAATVPIKRINLSAEFRWQGIDNLTFRPTFATNLPMVSRNLCGSFPGPHETEPNNSVGTADGLLCLGKTYTGSPDDNAPGAEFDWFKFYWDAIGTINVDVTNFLVDAQVLLYHESDTGNFLDQGFGGNYHLTHDGSAGPGVYYILVFAPGNHPTGNGNYNLVVTEN